ncbi:MAG: prepilin-type N-terminal cleavage/methylation domain-containing protein [Colwellia sp.]|nr:prepilin-type N-terminal cleavage/methylation domain-containing protein [Colwellia sp.]
MKNKNKMISESGFTMIELIVVIIILAIMATTVVPKFFTSTGFQEYTYQAEVITKLRSIQLRAMQQTNSSECHTVLVTEKILGIPENCNSTAADGWQGENTETGESGTTNVKIESNHEVTFDVSSGNYSFTFDGMGRPSCHTCLITVIGDSTLTIKVESEGYIHEY